MPKPTVRVRIAFADGPYVASPTWTDVTSYVRAVNTSRGRTDDWQDFDSGSATVVLDNRDRRFDPTYTAGPYYGNLQPRRQIYIDATTDGGSTYKAIFRGYIDGWPVNLTAAGFDSTVTISCYDVLGLISQNTAPYDWADAKILSLSPVKYVKCDDPINPASTSSTTLRDYGSSATAMTVLAGSGTVMTNDDSLAPGLPYRSIKMAQDVSFYSALPKQNLSGLTVSVWAGLSTNVSNNTFYFQGPSVLGYNSAGTFCQTAIAYQWNTTLSRYEVVVAFNVGNTTPTTGYLYTAAVQLDPSQPHHFAAALDLSVNPPTVSVFVDGVKLTAPRTAGNNGTAFLTTEAYLNPPSAQQFCVFYSQLSDANVQEIYNLSIGQTIETTAARFTRALGQTSVPASLYSTAASPAGTVAKINNGGEPIRNTIQYAGDSEGGEIYVTKAGVLTMTNRTWYQGATAATSQATFGSGGIPIGTDMTYSWTANGMRNALNMTWSGDTTVNVTDATSIAAYGTKQDNYETQLSTASDTTTLGNLLVSFGKFPRLVMSAIELNMALSLANWATVLDLELLQRITVAVPEKVGSTLTQTQIIQQIEHQITPGTWTTSILGSSRWSSVFILNTSVLDGTDLLG